MSTRKLIVEKHPGLALVPSSFLMAKQEGADEKTITGMIRNELIESGDYQPEDKHLDFYAQCLFTCYNELFKSTMENEHGV